MGGPGPLLVQLAQALEDIPGQTPAGHSRAGSRKPVPSPAARQGPGGVP